MGATCCTGAHAVPPTAVGIPVPAVAVSPHTMDNEETKRKADRFAAELATLCTFLEVTQKKFSEMHVERQSKPACLASLHVEWVNRNSLHATHRITRCRQPPSNSPRGALTLC